MNNNTWVKRSEREPLQEVAPVVYGKWGLRRVDRMAEAKSNAMPLIAAEVAQKYADTLCRFTDKLEGKQ